MDILIQSIRIIERERNEVIRRDTPETFSDYIKKVVRYLYDNTAVRDYETRSTNNEVIRTILDIIQNKDNDDYVENKVDSIAKRLLAEEIKAQNAVSSMSVVMQKGSLIQTLLFDPDSNRYAYLLAKVEHTDFIDVSDFSSRTGFSKDTKKIWKTCVFMIDDVNDDVFGAQVYSDTAAKFWHDGFLELNPINTDEANTVNAFRAIEVELSKVKKASPRDYLLLRNATVVYFRTHGRFDYQDYLKSTIQNYQPEELSQEKMENLITRFNELPRNKNFDYQFNTITSKISARIKKVYSVTNGVELRITDGISNLNETIQAYTDDDGNNYLKIKTDDQNVFNTFSKKENITN